MFIDANWAGSRDDKKNTSGGAFSLEKRLVSWTRKKKNCTSQSTTEEKYVVETVNYSKFFWVKQFLEGMKVESKSQ